MYNEGLVGEAHRRRKTILAVIQVRPHSLSLALPISLLECESLLVSLSLFCPGEILNQCWGKATSNCTNLTDPCLWCFEGEVCVYVCWQSVLRISWLYFHYKRTSRLVCMNSYRRGFRFFCLAQIAFLCDNLLQQMEQLWRVCCWNNCLFFFVFFLCITLNRMYFRSYPVASVFNSVFRHICPAGKRLCWRVTGLHWLSWCHYCVIRAVLVCSESLLCVKG